MAVSVPRHYDTPATLDLEPAREGARVGAVCPHQLQARKGAGIGFAYKGLGAEPVVKVSGVDMGKQDEGLEASTSM